MATIESEQTRARKGVSRRVSSRVTTRQSSLKTTEFWAMGGVIAAILIAAAVSDSLGDVRAWTLVTAVAAAYIISRGLAKAGSSYSAAKTRSIGTPTNTYGRATHLWAALQPSTARRADGYQDERTARPVPARAR